MPVSLLIALFLAFGPDSFTEPAAVPRSQVLPRALDALGGIGVIGVAALIFSAAIGIRVRRAGGPTRGSRRLMAVGHRFIEYLTLAVFGWTVLAVGWPEVVRSGLGLGDDVVVDELLILLPYLLGLLAGWSGLYLGERAIRSEATADRRIKGPVRHLTLKARQTLGLVLPAALIFSLGEDLARWLIPGSADDPYLQMAMMASMGVLVLILSPAFVRLTWPTRPLPAGPLRDRLERLSRRFGFRCTDILVWDTGGGLVNAGVTGALPRFRYVLLTDAMIEHLDPYQIAAVFGHEVGHIRHRHLFYFGFFFLGSLGVMALVNRLIADYPIELLSTLASSSVVSVVKVVVGVLLVVSYFVLVFGILSRRFERQADVFGCRAVSCDRVDCPPHTDLYGEPSAPAGAGTICPVGLRIFVSALASVAALNGLDPSARSWRHGSIAKRIAFLERLEGAPEVERRFQTGVKCLRFGLALVLISATLLAFATDSIDQLAQ